MDSDNQNILFTILHFNDVYDIQPNQSGKYGVVNFEAHLRKYKNKYPNNLVLFSGDCFSPSILSNIFEGKQMVKALNKLNIDVACYGNHEFDFEANITESLAQSCNFPWLLGNLKYKGTDFILGDGKPYLIKQIHGMKIGFFGIAGQDWLGILSQQYQNQLDYYDVGEHSRKMCKFLRQQQKCQMVIALTHMRVYQDQKLPLQAPDIDIILGGHDHIIFKQFINAIPVLKCGDNFKNLGIIQVYKKDKNPNAQYKSHHFDFDITIQTIPIYDNNIDEQLKKHVQTSMQQYKKTDNIIGYTEVVLQTRDCQIRARQTNYGNFLTDLARSYYDVDACIINSGSIRNNLAIQPGQLRYSVISNIINSVIVVKQLPGQVLLKALEYSVSALPGICGGFLQVSGIRFTYDLNVSPRIQEVYIGGQLLQLQKIYTVAIQMYIANGGDGFQMLKPCKMIVDPIAGIDLLRLLLKFFKGLASLDDENNNKIQNKVIQVVEKSNFADQITQLQQQTFNLQILKLNRRVSTRTNRISKIINKLFMNQKGKKYVCISPKTDNRITQIKRQIA